MTARPGQEPPASGQSAETSPVPRRRRHPVIRALGLFLTVLVIILAVAIVTSLSVDVGPALRQRAEQAGSDYLKRRMTIGRLSVRLLSGSFIVEQLEVLAALRFPAFSTWQERCFMP